MAENSKIEWTDHTFNPWRGCQHATLPNGSPHPGCEHCYAEALGKRNPAVLGTWGEQGTRVCAAADYWRLPVLWNKAAEKCGRRMRVFCASLADVFEEWNGPIVSPQGRRLWRQGNVSDPAEWVDERLPDDASSVPLSEEELRAGNFYPLSMLDLRFRLFWLIDATPWLDWLLLTKRVQNVWPMMAKWSRERPDPLDECPSMIELPIRNLSLGTSISDQATADVLVPALLKCRDLVPTLFLSCEPLLGPIDFSSYLIPPTSSLPFDWVIVGGESGPHARPMHPDWARSLRDQCQAAGVRFFFKQWGEWEPSFNWPDHDKAQAMHLAADGHTGHSLEEMEGHPHHGLVIKTGKKRAGRLLDGRTWDELPSTSSLIPPTSSLPS